MGPIKQRAIVTLAFAAALVVPALAGLAREPSAASQHQNRGCWALITQTNAGTMLPVCSSKVNW